MIPQEQIEKMKEQFIGKRISVETKDGIGWVGNCEFIGYNKYLPSWGFQVTLDRTPIQYVIPESIKLA
jgi:hypothetical protein